MVVGDGVELHLQSAPPTTVRNFSPAAGLGGGNPTKFLVGDPVEAAMGVVASSEWVEDDGAWMAARVTLDRLRTVVEVPSDRLRRAAELLRRVDKSCGWISHRMDCSDAESSHNAGCGVSTRGRLGGGEAILSVSMFFFSEFEAAH